MPDKGLDLAMMGRREVLGGSLNESFADEADLFVKLRHRLEVM